jgi:hypothetical protein
LDAIKSSDFFSFLGSRTHFRTGRHENKEKPHFYFGLRILLPIQIQLQEIENPKIQKSTSPLGHWAVGEVDFWIFLDFQFPTACN